MDTPARKGPSKAKQSSYRSLHAAYAEWLLLTHVYAAAIAAQLRDRSHAQAWARRPLLRSRLAVRPNTAGRDALGARDVTHSSGQQRSSAESELL
jgi:hypothetical protein